MHPTGIRPAGLVLRSAHPMARGAPGEHREDEGGGKSRPRELPRPSDPSQFTPSPARAPIRAQNFGAMGWVLACEDSKAAEPATPTGMLLNEGQGRFPALTQQFPQPDGYAFGGG